MVLDTLRSLLAGVEDEKYDNAHPVTAVRRLLNVEPEHETKQEKDFEPYERRLFNPIEDNMLRKRVDGKKCIRLNFVHRRLVDPSFIDAPSPIKLTSVPWGFKK